MGDMTLLSGVFFVVIGVHDLLLATRIQERAIGGILAMGGAASLVGIVLLVRGRRTWATGALLLGALAGLDLVVVQVSFSSDFRTWIWLMLAAIPILTAVLIAGIDAVTSSRADAYASGHAATRAARSAPDDSGLQQSPNTTKGNATSTSRSTIVVATVGASAAILASVIPFLGGAFRPVTSPNTLDMDVHVSVDGHRKDAGGQSIAVVNTAVTLKNISSQRLVFLGSAYSVQGYTSETRSSPGVSQWPTLPEELARSQPQRSGRFEYPSINSAIEVGYDFEKPGSFLEPGQHVTYNVLTPVPTAEANSVASWVTVVTAYEDRLQIGEQRKSAGKQSISSERGVSLTWDITPTSWTALLARGRPIVEVEYGLSKSNNPTFQQNRNNEPRFFDGMSVKARIKSTEPQSLTQELTQNPSTQYGERVLTFYGMWFRTGVTRIALDAERK